VPTRNYDAIIVGGGIIGLSIALDLRRIFESVLILDRSEPGREASYAAAGMLDAIDVKTPPAFATLAHESARLFPAFVDDIRAASTSKIDFQRTGAMVIAGTTGTHLTSEEVNESEPLLEAAGRSITFIDEDFVDPRTLVRAMLEAARHHDVHIASGTAVVGLKKENYGVSGVRTARREYHAPIVINCAGAWGSNLHEKHLPIRPVKGQMISLLPANGTIMHVVRANDPDIYLLPRLGGLIAVGATVEEAGFDKRVDPDVAKKLQSAAAAIIPSLADAKIHESWAGLRPGTPDDLPIIGQTEMPGYFVATGHYRNGILLAPVTAKVISELIVSGRSTLDLTPFSPLRFQ
jgi:glycine oxidase